MQLPNSNVLVGVKHFDLERLEKEFIGCTINSLADPTTNEGKEILQDFYQSTFVYTITKYIAEVGNSPNWALRMGEAVDLLFRELNIQGIHFLGCYMKNSKIPFFYDQIVAHLTLVLEFD